MSWLAKITIDYQLAYKRRFSDNYAWHWAAWQAFPGQDRGKRNYLTRFDYRDGEFTLLLLSHVKPMRPDWCPEDAWAIAEISPEFLKKKYYRFDLRANPTRKVTKLDDEGNKTKNGKRVALLKPEELRGWLERKAGDSGIRLLNTPALVIDPAVSNPFFINKRNEKGLHFSVRFTGAIEIIDQCKFENAFYNGIGSAKGFGFGMLMLKPININ
jgi:CRISPR system Cascade subunit CasE